METPNKPRILLKTQDTKVNWVSQPPALPLIKTPIKLKPKSKSLGFTELIKKQYANTVSFQYVNDTCIATIIIGEEPVASTGQGPLEAFQNLLQDLTRINFEE